MSVNDRDPRNAAELERELEAARARVSSLEAALERAGHRPERLSLEQKLRDSEVKYAHVFNQANDLIFIHYFNPEGNAEHFIEVNKAVTDLLGYTGEELRGMTPYDIMTDEDAPSVPGERQKLNASGELLFEKCLVSKDGTKTPVELHARLFDYKGRKAAISIARNISERRRIESELREREEILNEAQRIANLGSFVWDLRDDSLQWSPNMFEIAGLDADEIEGGLSRVVQKIIHPDDRENVQNQMAKMVEAGRTWSMEFRIVRPDGEVRVLRSGSRFGYGEDGKPVMCVGVHHDITEQKRALTALEESELRFATVIENLGDAVFVHDFEGRFVLVNRLAAEHTGYGREELLGMAVEDIDPASAERGDMSAIWEKMKPGDSRSVFSKHRRADGSEYPAEVNLTRIDMDGVPLMLAQARDVSRRIKAEERLCASEARYRMLLESLSDAVFVLGRDWRYLVCNQAAADFLHMARDKILGSRITELLPGIGETDFFRAYERVMNGGPVETVENEYVRPDGSPGHFEVRVYPVAEGILCIAADSTERRRYEEEMIKRDRLDSLALLAGGIAHDFNNYLMGIVGNISLAKVEARNGGDIGETLDDAEAAAVLAKELTRQLLSYSKGGDPERRETDLRELVEDSARFMLRGGNVNYRIDFDPDVPMLEIDPGQIGQVIGNIVINAGQAMPRGGLVRIRAALVHVEAGNVHALPPGEYVELSVEDTGEGIDGERLGRIFDPYFTTKAGGTGLGLATSYSIVKSHGGVIRAESEPGRWTRMTIFLPVPGYVSPANKEEPNLPARPKAKLLVVDGEEVVRRVASRMLERAGYAVETAETGGSALGIFQKAIAENSPFDIVLIDLTMPGGESGESFVQEIKTWRPDTRAVLVSGYLDDPALRDPERYGFDAVIAKPFKVEELEEIVSRLLRERDAGPGPSAGMTA